jgi:putative transposase
LSQDWLRSTTQRRARKPAWRLSAFVLRTGCQWNALDRTGICSCSSAYRRFREWSEAGLFLELWRQGSWNTTAWKASSGSGWPPTERWRNPPLGGEGSGRNPTDRAKQGTKRSLLTEGAGVPLGLEIAGANVNDFKLLQATLASIAIERPAPTPERPQGLCLDKGYDYPEVYELVEEFGFTAHIRSRCEEAVIASRSGIRGLWQPRGCAGRGGSSGSTFAHSWSGMRQPSSSTTRPISSSLVDFSNEVGLRDQRLGPRLAK